MNSTLKNRKEKTKLHDENNNEVEEINDIVECKWRKCLIIFYNFYKLIKSNIKTRHKYSFFMGLFIVFLICSGFFQLLSRFYDTLFYNVSYIDVSNTEKLKEIFFSNKPYLIYCKNDKNQKIHPNINSSKLNFPHLLNIAILNCKQQLPSKKTIYERFKIEEDTPAFIVVFGKKPKPISLPVLNNKKMFLNFIKESLVFNVPFFSRFPQFQIKCLNTNKKCILFIIKEDLLYNSRKYNYINDIFIIKKFFSINPLIINSNRYQLKLSDEIFESYDKTKKTHVLCLFNHTEINEEPSYYGYFYKDKFEDLNNLTKFISDCISANNKSEQAIKLSNKPKIKYRVIKTKIQKDKNL